MSFSFQTIRSFTNFSLTLATGLLFASVSPVAVSAQGAPNPAKEPNQRQSIVARQFAVQATQEESEPFMSVAELAQSDVQFTPASVDISALKRAIRYPEGALKNSIPGHFDLIVYVSDTGEVASVNFVAERANDESLSAVIFAACDAVKNTRFTSATLNGKAISSAVRIPFTVVP
jgi:outer membrane biosynthesis protein TonB